MNLQRIKITGLPVIPGAVAWIVYEMTHAPGFFWTRPDSLFRLDVPISPACSMLYTGLMRICAFITPADPVGLYMHLSAFWAALTVTGMAVLIRNLLSEETQTAVIFSITAALSLFFAFSTAFWSAAAQGLLLIPCGLMVWTLALWYWPDRRLSRQIFGLCLFLPAAFFNPTLSVLIFIPLSQAFMKHPDRAAAFKYRWIPVGVSVLLLAAGWIFLKSILTAPPNPDSGIPMNVASRLGAQTLWNLIRVNLTLPGFFLFLLVPVLRLRSQTLKGTSLIWLLALFFLYLTGFIHAHHRTPYQLELLAVHFIPVLTLWVMLMVPFGRLLSRAVPHKMLWLLPLLMLIPLTNRFSSISLASDTTCGMVRKHGALSVQPHAVSPQPWTVHERIVTSMTDTAFPFEFRIPEIHWLTGIDRDETLETWTRFCEDSLNILLLPPDRFHRITRIHLAWLWGETGSLWMRRFRNTKTVALKEYALTHAYTAYANALRFDGGGLSAADYTEPLALMANENQVMPSFLYFTQLSMDYNRYHYEANQRMFFLQKHLNNQEMMLRYVNRMRIVRPDDPELKLELSRLYLTIGLGSRARLFYDQALADGFPADPGFENLLPPRSKTPWVARNIMISH